MSTKPHKFEIGERVQLIRYDMDLPASGRGSIVRRYLHSVSGEPEYAVRFDHTGTWDEDWSVAESNLRKEEK